MKVFTGREALKEHIRSLAGGTIGFVPTMGALHEGHLSLVRACRAVCDVTVASVFVNPTQFNDKDDLRNYPRDETSDLAMLEKEGVDIVFLPPVEEVYPEPDTRVFDFGEIDKVMEGATRPGHFNGVAQVVSRLFDIVTPHKAFFGQKDFQQIAVIREMARQLGYGLEIVECPIVRAEDGLALSSRNALLDADKRAAAPHIFATLVSAASLRGAMRPAEIEKWAAERINENPHLETVYFRIADPRTLQPITAWDGPARAFAAVKAGNVRLIDNIEL